MIDEICERYIEILNREMIPAIGCTEPIAVAYASATASDLLNKKVDKIKVYVSPNMLKNGMGVGVPGTGMKGLDIAVAVGALGGNAEAKLEVLKDISEQNVKDSKKMLQDEKVDIEVKRNTPDLYIEVICYSGSEKSRVIIENSHLNIVLIELNDKVIFKNDKKSVEEKTKDQKASEKFELTVDGIFEFATEVPIEKIRFVREKDLLNEKIAEVALSGNCGIKVGSTVDKAIKKGLLSDDILTAAVRLATAGADARMAGSMCPTMSNSGSGNQGITASLPVIAVGIKLKSNEEKIIRALVLSNLIAIHIHEYLSRLAALCGTVVAGTGSACGITYLLGGGLPQNKKAINNMAGDVTGMICDGAKTSCALKVATAVSSAVISALLAVEDIGVSDKEGIIERDVEKTIKNVGDIGSYGMTQTDKMILDIMIEKQNK